MYHLYCWGGEQFEYCFNIKTSQPLTESQLKKLKQLLAQGFIQETIKDESQFSLISNQVVELGPRLNFATAFSTNAVSICHSAGLDNVIRIEVSRRYFLPENSDRDQLVKENHDRMTECVYNQPLSDFATGLEPEPVFIVPLIEKGKTELMRINQAMGLGMDDWDIDYYYDLFVNQLKKNPTNVECFQLGQANSEHSRHWFFKGKIIIDDLEMPENLLEIVQATLKAKPGNSLIAFKDNSSALKGYEIETIIPQKPGYASKFKKDKFIYHLIFTAETHNFPSGVAPFAGAETGTGGRIRDVQATGRGALVVAGTAGYCVGNLHIPGYELDWEDKNFKYPANLALPLDIEIKASNGASDYGNKFGEPLIQGFTRSLGLLLPSGERREWLKPIMFSGGIGQIENNHLNKKEPQKGMLIVQIGGPAYRIGIGGGAASSMIQGENSAELDFNAVQRGDAELEQKMNRVLRACVEMGEANPIMSIHDQGAGGPCNVLTELVEPVGGKIDIRNIRLGDQTMSVLEIWGSEYQERNALLIKPDRIAEFEIICQRERVDFEVLGEVTGDGKIKVFDSQDASFSVDLDLAKILGKMPQKTFVDKLIEPKLEALILPDNLTLRQALDKVLRLVHVGSKGFLVHKVDRSVTGLVAQQQCCGPLQLTVADVSVIAQSHFSKSGAAIAIGEQPNKIIVDPRAGARMSVAEVLTNIVWAKISKLEDIKCSGNWMWPAKLPGEGANLYLAASAMRDLMIDLGIAIDGGKDSLSMATKVDKDIVKSPNELVISAYASMPDIEKVITPDIKQPGDSFLYFIDLANNFQCLGGSALAQVYKQVGKESPDVRDNQLLKKTFIAIQELIDENIILAGHDRSDGGLITTLLEMAFAGNCGFKINHDKKFDFLAYYFNEELGVAVEVSASQQLKFLEILKRHGIDQNAYKIGQTSKDKKIEIKLNNQTILKEDMKKLRQIWQETSYQLEKLQSNPKTALQEKENIYDRQGSQYELSFTPQVTDLEILAAKDKPKVAIIREEGSNGDREMSSAFYLSGFEVWDVTMSDLSKSKIDLEQFRGVAFVGGFSYADCLGSAKGWASTIRFSDKLKKMFDYFYNRPDTFSLGVCNGCQLMGLLGWVPYLETADDKQPRFVKNESGRFESRWINLKVQTSPAIMLQGMQNSVLGAWVAHGEGRLYFPDETILADVLAEKLAPLVFVDDNGKPTEKYPFNPNGSPLGITSLCSKDGRHLAMMPHPERSFLKWQWPYLTDEIKKSAVSPWLTMFQNAYHWCLENPSHSFEPKDISKKSETASKKGLTYKDSGVDISAGDQAVDLIKNKVKQTFANYQGKILTDLGGFSGLAELPDGRIMGAATDGVGTKLALAILLDKHETIGIDLVAMCVNDLIVCGVKPAIFLDYIAQGRQIPFRTERIISGIVEGCNLAEAALIGGEMAEMSGIYRPDDYDLAGFAVGFAESKEDLILGKKIKPGMKVYGLPSSGIHSNGFSLVRKIFDIDLAKPEQSLEKLNTYYEVLGRKLGDELLEPTCIYVKKVKELLCKYDIAGLVHITGGGLIENPPRILPDNCAINLKLGSWPVQSIFKLMQEKAVVSLEEMMRTFNYGIGLMIISADKIEDLLEIGEVVDINKKVNFI